MRAPAAVMAVTVICEIQIPVPAQVDAAITKERLSGTERLLK
jgi:hypothetical protein